MQRPTSDLGSFKIDFLFSHSFYSRTAENYTVGETGQTVRGNFQN